MADVNIRHYLVEHGVIDLRFVIKDDTYHDFYIGEVHFETNIWMCYRDRGAKIKNQLCQQQISSGCTHLLSQGRFHFLIAFKTVRFRRTLISI